MDDESLQPWLELARNQGARLVYVFAGPGDARPGQLGLPLVDRKVRFEQEVEGDVPLPGSVARVNRSERPLQDLALASGAYSRFRLDPLFPAGSFERLYHAWLEKAFEQAVWVAEPDSSLGPAGLVTVAWRPPLAEIGLLAVAAHARRRGVGGLLLAAAQHQARSAGNKRLAVVTQGDNQAACGLYLRSGFRLVKETHVYHAWLSVPSVSR